MKVLWLVNIVLPAAARERGLAELNVGGWLTGQLDALVKTGVCVTVCSPCGDVAQTTEVNAGGARHILIPASGLNEISFCDIIESEEPDLIHIFGTEYAMCLEMVRAANAAGIPCVVSLQGIISVCAEHYLDGIPESYKRVSLLRRVMHKYRKTDVMLYRQQNFRKRGEREREALKYARNVIGRTAWDRACALEINPNLRYFHVNENLRDCFYGGEAWQYEACEPHTIFISQANYPIKGLHQLLKAMPAILSDYPDTQVYIAGYPPISYNNAVLDRGVDYFFEYQGYIHKLIRKLKLAPHIKWLGPLDAEGMRAQYMKANAFVCPSSIENSPNSVGEAMILGVPVVASEVGGTPSMLTGGEDGILYDFYDTDALARAVCSIFSDTKKAAEYGAHARARALETHDRKENTKALLNVYTALSREMK